MQETSPTPEITLSYRESRSIKKILIEIRREMDALALQLARMPATWQVLAHSLEWTAAPWFRELPPDITPWSLGFRSGSKRKSAKADLMALVAAKADCRPEERRLLLAGCAKYLRKHFSGEALIGLRETVGSFYKTVSSRSLSDWWDFTPYPHPKALEMRGFLDAGREENATAISIYNNSQRVIGPFHKPISQLLNGFCDVLPFRVFNNEQQIGAAQPRHHFESAASFKLKPQVIAQMQQRGLIVASRLVTTVQSPHEDNPDEVLRHVFKSFKNEFQHEMHRELGRRQLDLLVALIEAEFPLLYWKGLQGTAQPADKLPEGRRMELSPAECGKIFEELQKTTDLLKSCVHRRVEERLKVLASRLVYKHINAFRILTWVEAIQQILEHPKIAEYLGDKTVADAKVLAFSFQKEANEIRDIVGLLQMRNQGLAANIHQRFIKYNPTSSGVEDADAAAIIREEMLKTLASFDFTIGLRFSTYAVNRIMLELRRRPYQEHQLIKLGSDQTTAQPRVYSLATESELHESDPGFLADLAERYNAKFGGANGRNSLTAAQAGALLNIRNTTSLVAQSDSSGDEYEKLLVHDFVVEDNEISPSDLEDARRAVRCILDQFAPAEELAISLLIQATPPKEALRRFNRHYLTGTKTMMRGIITAAAKRKNSKGTSSPTSIDYGAQWGQSERLVRTKKAPGGENGVEPGA